MVEHRLSESHLFFLQTLDCFPQFEHLFQLQLVNIYQGNVFVIRIVICYFYTAYFFFYQFLKLITINDKASDKPS